ncbi:NADH-quinone oxidoreductase subunit J [uncultured Salinisphaera sp.]|uniref:NADH-quinone oxidoreductase subunit J n=1 Tax=uncultured Salinisphaera sp. TaxID=359372 RepID=UPI0032B1BBC9
MEFTFFLAGLIALVTTARVITCANPVHALLYLITSMLALAIDFYALGAAFAAVLEVVVYAGAIMVLFVFVVMMLNLNAETVAREKSWLRPKLWAGPSAAAGVLLLAMLWALISGGAEMGGITGAELSAREVGMNLFGPYVLVVELAAFLLLATLVVAAHIGRDEPNGVSDAAARGERVTSNVQVGESR